MLRRVRNTLTQNFAAELRKTKRDTRDEAIWRFWRRNWAGVRTGVLKAYRISSPSQPFDLRSHITIPPRNPHLSSTLQLICREQSAVFFVPGWEGWSEGKIAEYRAEEEMGR